MHGGKALLIFLVVAVLAAVGVFTFVPGLRPGFVQAWFEKATGFTDAKTPSDALDKFKLAIEKRKYQEASKYLTGDYKEWFVKGVEDGKPIAEEIDNLRAALKKNGVKSDKGQFVLFMLEPFPSGFTVSTPKVDGDTATAVIDWTEERNRHAGQAILGWQVDNRAWNSLVPFAVDKVTRLEVKLKKESDGYWRIEIPAQSVGRRVSDCVDYLRKNGSNIRNGLESVKNDVKNNPTTKENFETALKTKLEENK